MVAFHKKSCPDCRFNNQDFACVNSDDGRSKVLLRSSLNILRRTRPNTEESKMKLAYRSPRNFRGATKLLLDQILKTVESYQSQGYVLTLRQLYYQLVVQNIFANVQKNYAKLSDLLGEARMTGLCDWTVIEDRIRVPKFVNEFDNINDAMNTIIAVYRRKRWSDQENYVEVWVEKDALSGVLNR